MPLLHGACARARAFSVSRLCEHDDPVAFQDNAIICRLPSTVEWNGRSYGCAFHWCTSFKPCLVHCYSYRLGCRTSNCRVEKWRCPGNMLTCHRVHSRTISSPCRSEPGCRMLACIAPALAVSVVLQPDRRSTPMAYELIQP